MEGAGWVLGECTSQESTARALPLPPEQKMHPGVRGLGLVWGGAGGSRHCRWK